MAKETADDEVGKRGLRDDEDAAGRIGERREKTIGMPWM